MKVKISGLDTEVEEFVVQVDDFDKRLRVFAGPQVLRNDNLNLRTKLTNYYRLSKSAIKHNNLEAFAEAAGMWTEYLLEEADN